MKPLSGQEKGFTLVELTVALVILAIASLSFFGLYLSLISSTIFAKRQAVGLTLATSQMEYLKSLPYDSLTVQSPTSSNQKINGVTYTINSVVKYVDDAYDGCGTYANLAQKQIYCRNYPAPAGAPATDLNPADYKIARVSVIDASGNQLAAVDTQISARVSETASTTGALFVTITSPSGAPISGATVTVTNSTLSPVVNKADSSDSNGVVIFYGLPPDNGNDYIISASASDYSSLSTIAVSGVLQPTYANQKILTQQASYTTLKLGQQGTNSLLIETTDTNGAALANVKVYIKGGYKKYTAITDTSYYYDNFSPSDNRPTSDSGGHTTVQNLVPINSYLFCGDDGSSNCKIGATTYYLASAVPYGGNNSLSPIAIPEYDPTNPPATTFNFSGVDYLQEVRLMFTSSSTFPRVSDMSPDNVSLAAGGLNSFQIVITGYNLSAASAKLVQGANTYNGSSCSSSTKQLTCTFNLTGITSGTPAKLVVTNASGSLTLPTSPLGGFNVNP